MTSGQNDAILVIQGQTTTTHRKGGEMMSEKEKQTIKTMADIFSKLPADKQQYFNGYANGVADMAEAQAEKNDQDKD